MDPVTLAAAAVSVVTPYLLALGNEAAKSATGESRRSVWLDQRQAGKPGRSRGRHRCRSGAAGTREHSCPSGDADKGPQGRSRRREGARGPAQKSGASLSSQTATQIDDNKTVGHASGGSSVNITR
jgi:hypothetical protein